MEKTKNVLLGHRKDIRLSIVRFRLLPSSTVVYFPVTIECRNNSDEKTLDYLALHLVFYLESWGMYRGSTFPLQKDYKAHVPVVKILTEEKYDPLLGISAGGLTEDINLELLDDISGRIRRVYAAEQPSAERDADKASETLNFSDKPDKNSGMSSVGGSRTVEMIEFQNILWRKPQ